MRKINRSFISFIIIMALFSALTVFAEGETVASGNKRIENWASIEDLTELGVTVTNATLKTPANFGHASVKNENDEYVPYNGSYIVRKKDNTDKMTVGITAPSETCITSFTLDIPEGCWETNGNYIKTAGCKIYAKIQDNEELMDITGLIDNHTSFPLYRSNDNRETFIDMTYYSKNIFRAVFKESLPKFIEEITVEYTGGEQGCFFTIMEYGWTPASEIEPDPIPEVKKYDTVTVENYSSSVDFSSYGLSFDSESVYEIRKMTGFCLEPGADGKGDKEGPQYNDGAVIRAKANDKGENFVKIYIDAPEGKILTDVLVEFSKAAFGLYNKCCGQQ